jgi:hypothetical protein
MRIMIINGPNLQAALQGAGKLPGTLPMAMRVGPK